MSFSYLVVVAGCTPDGRTKSIRHTDDFSSLRADIKGSPGSHGDSPDMRSSAGKRLWDNCSNQIASLIPEVAFVPLTVTDRQADLIGVRHPAMSTSSGFDQQGEDVRSAQVLWC